MSVSFFSRSVVLLCVLAAGLGAIPAAAADRTALRAAFDSLPAHQRAAVQAELQIAGLYAGGVDGRYGAGTEAALIAGAEFLNSNSRGNVTVDVDSASGTLGYLERLGRKEYSAWLYGEGNECDC